MSEDKYTIIFTTCADSQNAEKVAKILLETGLAACIQIFPIKSMYFWKGKICDDNEVLLLIKSQSKITGKGFPVFLPSFIV